jgi:hypothetical protein
VAEDVISAPAPPEPELPLQLAPTRGDRARKTSYRLRFGIIYLVLAAIVGAGVGTFVVLASRPAPPEAAAWSSWEPTGSKLAQVRQIADRIPKAYKQPNGEQLTVTQASQLTVTTGPVASIIVRPDASRGRAEESDIDTYSAADAVSYGLCGLGSGSHCGMSLGTSGELLMLLSRQALELALYTFKYVSDVNSVVVFLPPSPEGQPSVSVFFRRGDVADELRRPLSHLLPARTPNPASLSNIELGNIAKLTRPRTYSFEFNAAGDGKPILILTPPPSVGS